MNEIMRGQLQCLLRAGRLELALDKAQSILASGGYKPGSIAQITSAGVEAAWKLGQWTDVQFFLSKTQEETKEGDFSGQQWCLNPHVRLSVQFLECTRLSQPWPSSLVHPTDSFCP